MLWKNWGGMDMTLKMWRGIGLNYEIGNPGNGNKRWRAKDGDEVGLSRQGS
jgi:hypothetical protein